MLPLSSIKRLTLFCTDAGRLTLRPESSCRPDEYVWIKAPRGDDSVCSNRYRAYSTSVWFDYSLISAPTMEYRHHTNNTLVIIPASVVHSFAWDVQTMAD
jgi:hypothetical protein